MIYKAFVAKVSGANGSPAWAKGFGSDTPSEFPITGIFSLKGIGSGGVIVTGNFQYAIGNLSLSPDIT